MCQDWANTIETTMGIKSTVKNNYLSGENANYVISNTVAVTV